MRIGWIGLGKLGSVCAAVQQAHGHDVVGYDPAPDGPLPAYEVGIDRLSPVPRKCCAGDVIRHAEVIYVAVQTPHSSKYGGEVPMPEDRRDFDYSYLGAALAAVFQAAATLDRRVTVVVVSTVLPGTTAHLIRENHTPENVDLVYSPRFVAMTTTVRDAENPEFVLLGYDGVKQEQIVSQLTDVERAIHSRPVIVMSIKSAELTKVAYNTLVSLKIVFANWVGEIAALTGADCDAVSDALSMATDRIVSPTYLRAGMGDGGSCHPRDNIALSWLAQKSGLSVDLGGFVTRAREAQTKAFADSVARSARAHRLPIVLLGKAYKPHTPLTNGSPALLLRHFLEELSLGDIRQWDPHTDGAVPRELFKASAVFVVATQHREFMSLRFPPGSVVIDPFGYIADQPNVTVVRPGRGQSFHE